jgi:hypothetical protein
MLRLFRWLHFPPSLPAWQGFRGLQGCLTVRRLYLKVSAKLSHIKKKVILTKNRVSFASRFDPNLVKKLVPLPDPSSPTCTQGAMRPLQSA